MLFSKKIWNLENLKKIVSIDVNTFVKSLGQKEISKKVHTLLVGIENSARCGRVRSVNE